MARCPECGSWIWHPPKWFEEHVCQNCGAVLKLKPSLGGFFLGSLEVVGHTVDRREDRAPAPAQSLPSDVREDIGDSYEPQDEQRASYQGNTPQQRECDYCHAPVRTPNAKFCSNCGASLGYGSAQPASYGSGEPTTTDTQEEARRRERLASVSKQEEDCIVCSLRLTRNDDVVWCPHCGGLAHRNHMLDWVRTKKCCPACDQPLNEEDYEGAN